MRVKILGAGSVGNHLAHACVRKGWAVMVVDRDPSALRRMREEIYPKRYGAWDPAITLRTMEDEPAGTFDLICIGTPPDVRMGLALAALREEPRILLLEKPLCAPNLEGLSEFLRSYNAQRHTVALVGYNHAVSASIRMVEQLLAAGAIGNILTIEVEFREHWRSIFESHPWLRGPADSYLGFWRRGGGASGEHSHALHLWFHLSHLAEFGDLRGLSATMKIVERGGAEYDEMASLTLAADSGLIGRVVQDVVTVPPRKVAVLQGDLGRIEWICNGHTRGDLVRVYYPGGHVREHIFKKTRPDDFYQEMLHIEAILNGRVLPEASPITLQSGVFVMETLAAAHKHRNQFSPVTRIEQDRAIQRM